MYRLRAISSRPCYFNSSSLLKQPGKEFPTVFNWFINPQPEKFKKQTAWYLWSYDQFRLSVYQPFVVNLSVAIWAHHVSPFRCVESFPDLEMPGLWEWLGWNGQHCWVQGEAILFPFKDGIHKVVYVFIYWLCVRTFTLLCFATALSRLQEGLGGKVTIIWFYFCLAIGLERSVERRLNWASECSSTNRGENPELSSVWKHVSSCVIILKYQLRKRQMSAVKWIPLLETRDFAVWFQLEVMGVVRIRAVLLLSIGVIFAIKALRVSL